MNKFLSTTLSVMTLAALSAPAFAADKTAEPAATNAPAVKTAAPTKLIKGHKIRKSKASACAKKASGACTKDEKATK